MNKHIKFIKKLITTALFIVTVLLYLSVNYTTAVNLSSIKRPLGDKPTTAAKKATKKKEDLVARVNLSSKLDRQQ